MVQIAYIIVAHKNFDQVIRLVHRLNAPHVEFLIHIDKKATANDYDHVRSSLHHLGNCHFLERISIYWGSAGFNEATIFGINYIEEHHLKCDAVFVISGQEYPIKSNEQIEAFCEDNLDKQYLHYFPIPTDNWIQGGLNRINCYHFWIKGKRVVYPPFADRTDTPALINTLSGLFPFSGRKIPGDYQPYGGSAQSLYFSRDAITYMYELLQTPLGKRLHRFFELTNNSSELFFHTILLNSRFKDSIVDFNLTYTDWSAGGPHPKNIGTEDLPKLLDADELFARKFDEKVDAEIFDLLDEVIVNSSR